jgi:hypothetical protein
MQSKQSDRSPFRQSARYKSHARDYRYLVHATQGQIAHAGNQRPRTLSIQQRVPSMHAETSFFVAKCHVCLSTAVQPQLILDQA